RKTCRELKWRYKIGVSQLLHSTCGIQSEFRPKPSVPPRRISIYKNGGTGIQPVVRVEQHITGHTSPVALTSPARETYDLCQTPLSGSGTAIMYSHRRSKTRWLLLAANLFILPAFAQVDFSGEWAPRFYEDQPERVPGPELGDYLGIPLNEAGRMRGDTWSASLMTLPEWQCRPHSADYIWRGPSNLRIWKEVDPVSREITAFHAEWLRSIDRPVYLDGRPHPPEYAAHTWAGFSTAKWDGDVFTVTVTHLKEGYVRRNGLARSDMATLTEHWIRHGDWLTVVEIVNDPVYLAEPFIRTTDYELDLHQQIPPYPCEVVNEVPRAKGTVP